MPTEFGDKGLQEIVETGIRSFVEIKTHTSFKDEEDEEDEEDEDEDEGDEEDDEDEEGEDNE